MRFLVDECLHTSLIKVLNDSGYEAYHAVYLGMSGWKDHDVMKRVRKEDFVFVTNNASDFRALFSHEDVHPGLIVIIPNLRPEHQRSLLSAGLRHIGDRRDLINKVIEIDIDGSEAVVKEYDWPVTTFIHS